MSLTPILLFVALGLATGVAAGLFGIGGGILLVPGLTLIFGMLGLAPGLGVHMAVATSLATVLFTSASSVYAHDRRGAVRWSVAVLVTPGLLVGSWFGPRLAASLSGGVLSGIFAVFVFLSALHLLYAPEPHIARDLPGWRGMSVFGVLLGTFSGVIGGGGAFLSIPFMIACNVPIHTAVATAAAFGFPIAFAGTLSNVYHGWGLAELPASSLGYVYAPALVAVGLASVLAAPLGVRLAHGLDVAALRRLLAYFLMALGAYMFWRAFNV